MPIRGIPTTVIAAIHEMARSGVYSQTNAARALRNQGFQFANERFRAIWNEVVFERGVVGALRNALPDVPLSSNMFVPVSGVAERFRRPFQYVFRAEVTDTATGEVSSVLHRISFDNPVSINEARQAIQQLFSQAYEAGNYSTKYEFKELRIAYATEEALRNLG